MWVKVNTITIIAEREIAIDPTLSSRFIIEIPRIKESWDLAGWVYLQVQTEIGTTTEQWKRIYFGKKQQIRFKQPNNPYNLVVKVVDWMPSLTTYDINLTIWRWQPIYIVNYIEKEIHGSFSLILPVNFSRQEYDLINLGTVPIEIYWGESPANTVELSPGFGLKQEIDKRSLSARSVSGTGSVPIRILERSEV